MQIEGLPNGRYVDASPLLVIFFEQPRYGFVTTQL